MEPIITTIKEKLDWLFEVYETLDTSNFSGLGLDKHLHIELAIIMQDAKIKILEAYQLLRATEPITRC